MFASKSLWEHLARGAAGVGALVAAVALGPTWPWLSLALLPLALVALRGCPMCWTVGLVQTLHARLQKKPTEGLCVDGACGLQAPRRGPSEDEPGKARTLGGWEQDGKRLFAY